MRVYIIRHGQANSANIDPQKGLSPKGNAQALKIGKWLAAEKAAPAVVYHSGKARARQTAEIILDQLRRAGLAVELEERRDINPDSDPRLLAAEISAAEEDLMFVSHLPFVLDLTAELLGDRSAECDFSPACAAGLEAKNGGFRLLWLVNPENLA